MVISKLGFVLNSFFGCIVIFIFLFLIILNSNSRTNYIILILPFLKKVKFYEILLI